jgi:hypothetical protein
MFEFIIIEKKTGAYLDINTIVMSVLGKDYDEQESVKPAAESGQCTLLVR